MRTVIVSVLLLAAVVPWAPPAAAAAHTIAATNFAWTPSSLSIDIGDTVTFTNEEGTHTWELTDQSDSCSLPCTRTFEEGTVDYRCGVHPSMTGTIVVGAAPSIAITSPAPGATLTGVVRIEGVASHVTAEIASVSVQLGTAASIDATLVGTGTSVSWFADVPTTQVPNGARSLQATASTEAGLSASTSISVVVSNAVTIDMRLIAVGGAASAITSNNIAYQLRNDGNTASTVQVRLEYLYHDEWRILATLTHPVLAAGATDNGVFTWALDPTAPHVGQFAIRATLDPDAELPDPNRANNVGTGSAGWFTSSVPGVILTEP